VPRRRPKPEEDEPGDQERDLEEEGGRRPTRRGAEPVVRSRKARPEPEDDEPEEEQVVRSRKRRPDPDDDEPEDRADDSSEEEPDEELPRPRKRRRKKGKRKKEVDPTLVAMIVSCIGLVLLCAGGIYMFQKIRPKREKATPEQALAALQQANVVLKRDPATQDVIGVDFSPTGDGFRAGLIDQLAAFPKLKEISLTGTKATGYDLDHLEGLASVTILRLGHTNMTDGGMRYIAQYLPNLEELDINQTLVTDNGLSDLKGLKKLRKLRVGGSLATGRGLQAAIPNLEIGD
jgi:hypothetical protein